MGHPPISRKLGREGIGWKGSFDDCGEDNDRERDGGCDDGGGVGGMVKII